MTDLDPSPDDQAPTGEPGFASPPVAPAPTSPPVPGAADATDDPTPPRRPRPTGPVQYKGDDLDAERGPGLGCFRFQVIILVVFIFLTPLSVVWNWPPAISAGLLFAVIFLLLITGQTIIFLLRLVAMDRRGRRRPLASDTKTVGEIEDEATAMGDGAAPPLASEDDGPPTSER